MIISSSPHPYKVSSISFPRFIDEENESQEMKRFTHSLPTKGALLLRCKFRFDFKVHALDRYTVSYEGHTEQRGAGGVL